MKKSLNTARVGKLEAESHETKADQKLQQRSQREELDDSVKGAVQDLVGCEQN
jgi:hypothetical protein